MVLICIKSDDPDRQFAAAADQAIEGVELDLVVMSPGIQAVEIGNTIHTEQHGLAIDHERCVSIPQRRLEMRG